MPGQDDHGSAQTQRLCARGSPGQEIEARRELTEPREMMFDNENAVVAKRLGLDDIVDPFAKTLAAIEVGAAPLGERAAEQSEFHVSSGPPINRPDARSF